MLPIKQKARQEPAVKVTYEQYRTIAILLIKHLKHLEQSEGISAISALLNH